MLKSILKVFSVTAFLLALMPSVTLGAEDDPCVNGIEDDGCEEFIMESLIDSVNSIDACKENVESAECKTAMVRTSTQSIQVFNQVFNKILSKCAKDKKTTECKDVVTFATTGLSFIIPLYGSARCKKFPDCSHIRKEAILPMLRQFAKNGVAYAQFHLGVMYDEGDIVKENDREAVRWYRKAAEQGNADAQYNLALMYHNGHGVITNNEKACVWLLVAQAFGSKVATRALNNRCGLLELESAKHHAERKFKEIEDNIDS